MKLATIGCAVYVGTVTAMTDTNVSGVGCNVRVSDERDVFLSANQVNRLRGTLNIGTEVTLFVDKETDEVLHFTIIPVRSRKKFYTPSIDFKFIEEDDKPLRNFFNRWVSLIPKAK